MKKNYKSAGDLKAAKGKDKPKNEPKDGAKDRSYTLSAEAVKIMDEVYKVDRTHMAVFVSECICAYGPELFEHKYSKSIPSPTLAARIKFLEDIYLGDIYNDLVEEIEDEKSTKQHQDVLNEFKNILWCDDLSNLIAHAKNNKKTRNTEDWQWRVLIRYIDEFMELVAPTKQKINKNQDT